MENKQSDYEEYLEKYCRSRGISREEAEKHAIVMAYKKWKEEQDGTETGIHSSQFQQDV